MSYGRSTSGEFAPNPRPYTDCPVDGCGAPCPQTHNEDEAYCVFHAGRVSRNVPPSPVALAGLFGAGDPADDLKAAA